MSGRIEDLVERQIGERTGLIALLEERLETKARIEFQPPQAGDVAMTCADVSKAERLLGWRPVTPIEKGVDRFCGWLQRDITLEMKR